MRGGVFSAGRHVFPIRQEMHGDEIDIGADFPVAQPEFPDVGVGHGNIHARLDRADDLPQVRDDHLAAQQHFAADNDRRDRAGMVLDQGDGGVDQERVLGAIASDPDAKQDLQSGPRREFRHLVQPVVDGIGADAFGYLGELGQILGDLVRADDQCLVVRRLIAPERRVGNAFQLRRAIERRAHQGDWQGQPPPDRRNDTKGSEEERQRRAQGDDPVRFAPM